MSSDQEILHRIEASRSAAARAEAFTELYDRHANAVFAFVLMVGGSRGIAEETTQETFMHVLENAQKFDAGRAASARPWLLGIARNFMRSLKRHERFSENLADEPACTETPEWALGISQRAEATLNAIRLLDREQREVLVLCVLQEQDYQTAASVLDIPVGTVRSRLSRARVRLAALVADEEPEKKYAT